MKSIIKNGDINQNNYARRLIEVSLDPLVTISSEGKITDVNKASVKVTGIPREKLIGTDFSKYFTEPENAQKGYLKVFKKGFVTDYPLTIKNKNGNLTDVLYNASVYKDDKGNVLGVFASARDITEQKQVSQYARSLLEASLDPLVTISAEGKITDVNKASVKVTGIPREKLINTNFSNYFTNPKKAQKGYLQVFEKGFVTDYPLTIKNKNGNLTDVLYNASVYKDDKGKVLGVFASARDVTEQKWAVELRSVNKELANQNEEKEMRAAELAVANKELVFHNEEKTKRTAELEIANKQLIDFCNIVSHNLRAPLVNIILLVDYLEESKDEDERKDLLKKTKLVTSHLNEVLNELVESIQVKQDTEIRSDKIILKDCLDSILIGFGAEINAYEADIQINFNNVYEIYNSRKYIDSILTNLISNTLKYKSPDRKPVVKIKLEKINGNIILSVDDNGLGIDLIKHQDNLFKIRKTFHKHPDAKGFGLYLVKTQVEAIGGKIWATSIPNIGSTFFVEFKNQNT
jgi:PAS domain S-box-containing protein